MSLDGFRPIHALVHIRESEQPNEAAKLWMKHALDLELPTPTDDATKWIHDLTVEASKDDEWVAYKTRSDLNAYLPPEFADTALKTLRDLHARRQADVERVVEIEHQTGKPAIEVLVDEVKPFAQQVSVLAFAHYVEGRLLGIKNAVAEESRHLGRKPTIGKDGTEVVRSEINALLNAGRKGISVDSETRLLLAGNEADLHCRTAVKNSNEVADVIATCAAELEGLAETSRLSPSISTANAKEIQRLLEAVSEPQQLADLAEVDFDEGSLAETGKRLTLLGSHEVNCRETRKLDNAILHTVEAAHHFRNERAYPQTSDVDEIDQTVVEFTSKSKSVVEAAGLYGRGLGFDRALAPQRTVSDIFG